MSTETETVVPTFSTSGAPVMGKNSRCSLWLIAPATAVDASITQTELLLALAVISGDGLEDTYGEINRFGAASRTDLESKVALQTMALNLVNIIVGKPEAPEGAHAAFRDYVAAWRPTPEGQEWSKSVAVPGQRKRQASAVLGLLGVTTAAPRQTSAIARQRAEYKSIAEDAANRAEQGGQDDLAADLRRQLEAAQKRR